MFCLAGVCAMVMHVAALEKALILLKLTYNCIFLEQPVVVTTPPANLK